MRKSKSNRRKRRIDEKCANEIWLEFYWSVSRQTKTHRGADRPIRSCQYLFLWLFSPHHCGHNGSSVARIHVERALIHIEVWGREHLSCSWFMRSTTTTSRVAKAIKKILFDRRTEHCMTYFIVLRAYSARIFHFLVNENEFRLLISPKKNQFSLIEGATFGRSGKKIEISKERARFSLPPVSVLTPHYLCSKEVFFSYLLPVTRLRL